MFDKIKEGALRLAELRGGSGSDEEFRLRAAARAEGFWASLLFRLCVFRIRRPSLEWLELAAFGLGVAGFALWGGIVGPKSALGGVGIILLANAVMVPLEILAMKFEDFCRGVSRKAFPETGK